MERAGSRWTTSIASRSCSGCRSSLHPRPRTRRNERMASFRKKGKVWYFRFTDAEGVKRERKGCPDRRATEEMARKAETEAAKVRAGMVSPEDVRVAEHVRRSL